LALLVLAIVLHALLLWRGAAHFVDLDHDSTIGYLAATGHQGAWDRLPVDEWFPAREIQRLFQIDERWPLARIRDDLARTDIHPPLYFWRLHAQLLPNGAAPWAFFVLNGALDLLSLILIVAIGRRVWDAEAASGAALLWATSWGAWATAGVARPYAMLVVVSLAFVRLAIGVLDRRGRPSIPQALLLVLVSAVGFLTHYQFLLVVAAVLVALVLGLRTEERGRLWPLAPILLAGFVAFVLIDPMFAQSFARQRAQAQPFTFGDLLPRLRYFVSGLEGLARPPFGSMPFLLLAGALLAWLLTRAQAVGAFTRLRDARESLRALSPRVRLVLVTAITFTALQGVLYLAHVTPAHAAGDRYNAVLWPLFALLAVGAIRGLGLDRAATPVLAIAVFFLTYSSAVRSDQDQVAYAHSPAWHTLAEARVVVADHAQRGVLPRTMLRVPPDAYVWVVRPSTNVDSLMAGLHARGRPVTLLVHPEAGDPRVTRAIERLRAAGDSFVPAGVVPAGTQVMLWRPRR
jgi:hypothetical protein